MFKTSGQVTWGCSKGRGGSNISVTNRTLWPIQTSRSIPVYEAMQRNAWELIAIYPCEIHAAMTLWYPRELLRKSGLELKVWLTKHTEKTEIKATSIIWTWVSGWNLYISYLIKFPWSNGHSPSKLIWSEAAAYCCDSPKSNIVGKNTIVNMLNISACRILFHEMPVCTILVWMPHLAMSVLCPFTTTDTVIIKPYIHIHIGGVCCQYI